MKTNKKMNMAMAIVCCAVGLLAPAKVQAFWANICAPQSETARDQAMLSAIGRASRAWESFNPETCTMEDVGRMQGYTGEMTRIAATAAGENIQNVQVALFNNTPLAICRIQITPCVNYGGAVPRTLSGWVAPMSGAYAFIGAANAHYNIRFLTNGGVPIDFCDVFIGAGTSTIILTHVGQGRYVLSRM